jgi:hypothetical protein
MTLPRLLHQVLTADVTRATQQVGRRLPTDRLASKPAPVAAGGLRMLLQAAVLVLPSQRQLPAPAPTPSQLGRPPAALGRRPPTPWGWHAVAHNPPGS